ncbi:MAG TPA: cytochrome c3 family protein [Myxococcales bacterium]|jgi:predicted CXXCH cytochrome family protein|nr:cytochrome c3 family protein [Myxococcales bacterium]
MPWLPPQVIALALLAAAPATPPQGPGDDCLACHGALAVKKIVHPPVKNGLCVACHEPADEHSHRFVMRQEDKRLCTQCHAGRSNEAVLHNPVVQGLCLACHDPHQSDNLARLRKPVKDTCTTCHPSKRLEDAHAATKHGALDPEQNPKVCVACHDPHQSPYAKRLKADPPMEVCLTCHDKPLQSPTGPLLNMKAWLDQHPETWMRHGPVREGQCQLCHNPHGTDNLRMLRAPFPRDFYAPLEAPEETYALCMGCHDRRLLQERYLKDKAGPHREVEWTEREEGKRLTREGITGFRNGDENLHWRHVNKPDKGRTCRACHDFHASNNPKHIRETTKFGNWEFKLNYRKTETGGGCSPGCHVERHYDRVTKQENPR